MGSELTSMCAIGALVRASLDIDVLRHLHHHWRLCQCCHRSPFVVVFFISVIFISVVFINVVLVVVFTVVFIVVFIILLVHGKVLTIRNSK